MKRIFLIGYMGAGKSTLGKSLACRMNLNYIDTDHFIENRYRKKVSDLFACEGEERFRQIEQRVLLEVSEFEDVIISTGGGLPCFCDNMTIMNERGITVFVDVPVEELVARLNESKNIRPLLKERTGDELAEFIREHLDSRRPFYEQSVIQLHVGQVRSENDVEHLVQKLVAMLG